MGRYYMREVILIDRLCFWVVTLSSVVPRFQKMYSVADIEQMQSSLRSGCYRWSPMYQSLIPKARGRPYL